MAEYHWDPRGFGRVLAIPAAVAEQHLKLAGPIQLKVLLWHAANGTFDPDACAAAVGYPAADCVDAMQYWVSAGVLGTADAPPSPVAAAPAPAASVTAPVSRPKAVKPQLQEVIAAQNSSPEFAYLLDTVSARLGKPLSGGDMETLLYLFNTAGLPAEVILMAVGYAAQSERFTLRYIEKVALDWADRGILTIAAAEEYLCYLERCQQALLKVQTVCGLPTPIPASAANQEKAEKWVFGWRMSDDLLREAARICEEKTGKFGMAYANAILENWHAQGVTTVEQVREMSAPAKKRAARPADDSDNDYEQMVEQYVPVYKKKKKG